MRLRENLLAIMSVLCVSLLICGCLGGDSGEQQRGSESTIDDLISDLNDDNIDVRREAARALGDSGDPKAVGPLSDTLLNDTVSGVRDSAAVALGKIGDPRAVDPLIKALNDSSISNNAARALGNIGDPRAVDPLIKSLESGSDWTRSASAEALGKIGDDRAVGPLTEALNDEDDYVRKNAAEALGKLGVEVETKPDKEVSEKTSISDSTAMSIIRTSLTDAGFSDVTTQVANGRAKGGTKSLILSYKSSATTAQDVSVEISSILGAFLGTIKRGWDCDELSVVIGDINGNAIGMWYCSKTWTDEYIKGTMTSEEIILKALGTVQTL